jgi:hypothetical protein
MEVVFEEFERAAEIALPAVRVAGEQEVKAACLGLVEHLDHRRGAPDRRAALGHLEEASGVDEAIALDEAILLLALTRWAEAVVLTLGRLSYPAGDPQAPYVVERARQPLHAALPPVFLRIRRMFALASSASLRIWSGPSG